MENLLETIETKAASIAKIQSDLERSKLEALEAHKVEQVCESVEPNVGDSSVVSFHAFLSFVFTALLCVITQYYDGYIRGVLV